MMDWTDRHCRFFHRLLTRHALLYSEMVTADAVLHGDRTGLLAFNSTEHPIALQLGGCDPAKLAQAAAIAVSFGYDEVNLNVGCPSSRVQEGRFGACLMAEPRLVADCISAMGERVAVPVTVKCRIGIDDQDTDSALEEFVAAAAGAGCGTFIVHARKAWLKGLSPKQNREIPPLDYQRVYRLKASHPELEIVINGGIGELAQASAHLRQVDGVALGRSAYQNPYLLSAVDASYFGATRNAPARAALLEALIPYAEEHMRGGGRLNNITRHVLGLYHGQPRARAFRRYLSEHAPRDGADASVLKTAIRIAEGLDTSRLVAAE
jgi:tRNA-dihydrouridine synthase A